MRLLGYFLLGAFVVFLDFVSKAWALSVSTSSLVINYGVSWGIGSQGAFSGMLFGGLALVVAVIFALSARLRYLRGQNILPEALLVSGACANIFDRLIHSGGVVDFIDLGVLGISFPVFNVADIAVVSGVCLLLLRELIYEAT